MGPNCPNGSQVPPRVAGHGGRAEWGHTERRRGGGRPRELEGVLARLGAGRVVFVVFVKRAFDVRVRERGSRTRRPRARGGRLVVRRARNLERGERGERGELGGLGHADHRARLGLAGRRFAGGRAFSARHDEREGCGSGVQITNRGGACLGGGGRSAASRALPRALGVLPSVYTGPRPRTQTRGVRKRAERSARPRVVVARNRADARREIR